MLKHSRSQIDDLRGMSRLAVDATRGVTGLVEAMHRTIAAGPNVLGRPLERPVRLLTGLVYGSIRGGTQLVGASIDLVLGRLAPLLGEATPGAEREAAVAVLNGVLGDYLQQTKNPLAIPMRFRRSGWPLELSKEALTASIPEATGKLLIMVHGSCRNDLGWLRKGHDHAAALARDLGYTPVYLHYNSGLHISTNGHQLALLLEQLVAAWPVPITELTILAHSMGGLVARSACQAGAGQLWRAELRRLICLGTPHHGAPLERGGNWIDALLTVSRYSAPFTKLGQIRSAGVTDLRYGIVDDDDWVGRDRFAFGADPRAALALPLGVSCYAIAATTSEVAAAELPGDGLVPVTSALGSHPRPELTLAFPKAHQAIVFGTDHLGLLDSDEVYQTLRRWLSEDHNRSA